MSDPSLQPLRADLLPRDRTTLLQTDDDGAKRTVLWAPDRKWLAVAEHLNPILLLTPTGEEVFAIGITTGEDLNDSGDLLPRARKRVSDRLAQANDALAALGFQKLDGQWKDAQGPRAANRVALSTKPLTIFIRENVVSLRAKGKPAVVAKLFNMGSLGIDWGFLPTTVPVVVVSWSRVAGNDECPNGRGVVVFPTP